MKKSITLLLASLAVLLLAVPTQAQDQTGERAITQHTADGSLGQVFLTGTHRMVSVVGQSVAGGLGHYSGGIWKVRRTLQAAGAGALETLDETPEDFALEANYPNPFNPETTIGFALPVASHVQLLIYDMLGREVARLVDGEQAAGRHTVVFAAGALPSGLYLYRLVAEGFTQNRTMLLVK